MTCKLCKKKILDPHVNQKYHQRCAQLVLIQQQEKRRRKLGFKAERRRSIWKVILEDKLNRKRFYQPYGVPV